MPGLCSPASSFINNKAMAWNYKQPVEVIFGRGSLDRLGEVIDKVGGKRGLLVTSRSFARDGGVASRALELACGRLVDIYSAVSPNPDVKECDACIESIRHHDCDFVVALGGGSVMDCAKAASVLCRGDISSAEAVAGSPLPASHIPVIAVPTTAGTGSEVTSVSVLSDHERGLKVPLNSPEMYPAVALVDPLLTLSAPPHLTASAGLDALCHAIEAFWSRHHQPVCDALAIEAASLVMNNLERAVKHPDDVDAREKMVLAAVIAGMAFAIPKTSAPHACSYPLTNRLGIAHGEACALTLTWFLRFNADKGCERLRRLSAALGYETPEALATAIDSLAVAVGAMRSLVSFNLSEEEIENLEKACMHPNLRNNPVDVTVEDIHELFRYLTE